MIYLVGEYFISEGGLYETVDMASTNIQTLFDSLSLDKLDLSFIVDKSIVIMPDGSTDKYELAFTFNMLHRFDITVPIFIKECDEYNEIRTVISSWDKTIRDKVEEKKRAEELEKQRRKEYRERAAYKRLKAKYENQ
jgi:hypothetical protein